MPIFCARKQACQCNLKTPGHGPHADQRPHFITVRRSDGELMSFIKGMAAGVVAGAVISMALMPKPKRFTNQLKKSADRAAHSLGDLVDSVISVIH